MQLPKSEVHHALRLALREDVGPGDFTTLAVVPLRAQARGFLVARQPLVVAGMALAKGAFQMLSRKVAVRALVEDGNRAALGQRLLEIKGPARPILTAERVALNFIQRLSGIATLTAEFVAAVRGTSARILDTRKTTPGLRALEKYAVRCGGGANHRFGLHDMILIKDNHLAVVAQTAARPIRAAIELSQRNSPGFEIEIEVENADEAGEAAAAGARRILLDNMKPSEVRAAVRRVAGRARLEVSGGITLRTVRAFAAAGADDISVGALTHSAPAVDIGLDLEIAPTGGKPF